MEKEILHVVVMKATSPNQAPEKVEQQNRFALKSLKNSPNLKALEKPQELHRNI